MKKKLSLILSFIFTVFLIVNNVEMKAKADTTSKPELTITSSDSDNYVHLNWTAPDENKYYSYRLFSKESSEPKFQSIPSKAKVKVLNIYPLDDENGNPKGDNLKSWMESPNEECDKGYGKGLISVDKISVANFNKNPRANMINADGTWKYDVIMLGSWDTNFGANPSNDAVNLFSEFIDSGRGFLAGHDTIGYEWGTTKGLGQIRDKFNIKVGYWGNSSISTDEGHHYFGGYIGDKVTIKKKGLLTNYPWKIEDTKSAKELDKDNNVILTVPYSHSTGNFAYGDIWMTYSDNVKYKGSNFPDSLNEKANYYLTTYNNTAMIQTGHSNGAATPDEQKVLANTLFYLAQVTEDTKWDDHKGQDLKAPTKPELKTVIKDGTNNKLVISYGESQDIGSSYDYYVEAKEKATGNTVNSDVKTTTVTSGLKGYSIVVDQNKDTIPDNTIESTSTEYTIDNKFNEDFYVHVAAVDNAGNVSEVSTYKYVYPTLNLTAGDLNTDNNTVTIKAEGKVTDKTIKSITLPDGTVVEGSNAEFTVDVNGTYIFKAVDNEGNEVSNEIRISNIPGKVTLGDVKVNEDKASTTLNWSISDKTQDYSYNVNSKKSDETEFKSESVNGTTYVDNNAKDVALPEKSEIKSVTTNREDKTTLISFSESTDNGTSYDYYVDGTGLNSGLTSKSETKSATVTSGIKGYSIVVDQNEDTIPDGTITTTSTDYTFDKLYDTDFYVHVAAVDNAGNISEVSSFKYAYPVLKLTPNTTEVVKDTVTITAEAACEGNSIVKIITPDGKEVDGDKAQYTVDVNGAYTFKAIDSKGDEVTESIEITNIVPDVILNVESNMNRVHLEENFVVDLTIDHVTNIGAVDVRLKYDDSKLKLLSIDKTPGVIFFTQKESNDVLRFTFVSLGDSNFINNKQTLLKLNFTGTAAGDALIDIIPSVVTSEKHPERFLREAECGETTINICDRKLRTDITLADLAMIGKHLGEDPEKLLPDIDVDFNLDGKIDEADIEKAYNIMINNPNYKYNAA